MWIRASIWFRVIRASVALAAIGLPSVSSAAIQFPTSYQTIPSMFEVAWVRVLDVNRDGIEDLVVRGSSNSIWYHRGLQGGGYAPVTPLVSFPAGIVLWDTGDINNDGCVDMIAADLSNTAWSVLGNGDGTFQAPRGFLSLFWGSGLKLGDLDGDGTLDVVAAVNFGPLYTMKGLGDGRFQLTSLMQLQSAGLVDLVIADFDGDSLPDVMAVNLGPDSVDYFHGIPGGLLDPPVAVPMPGYPRAAVGAGDLDGDGYGDAVVLSVQSDTNVASFIYGAPVGTPFDRVDLPREGIGSIAVVDLDGNGVAELLATERASSSGDKVTILGRSAPRAYTLLADFAGGVQPYTAVWTDTNGDGRGDIVVCNPPRSQLAVLRGHGGMTFGEGQEVRTFKMAGFDVGDVNGDRIPDIVTNKSVWAEHVAGVHIGIGDGTFLPMSTTAGPHGCCGDEAARLVDVNMDGHFDLIGVWGYGLNGDLDVLIGNGQGQFAASGTVSLASKPNSSIVVADFNADGYPDTAIPCSGGIAICLGTSLGQFNPPTFLPGAAKSAATADFDGDGYTDLIASNSSLGSEFGSQISVFLGRGDGTFLALPTFYGGYKPITFGVSDVTGDGIVDLAIGNEGDRTIALFFGAGNGTFTAGPVIPNVFAAAIEFVDLDGDGVLDMAATVYDDACVRVWPGIGQGAFGSPLSFGTRSNPRILRVADFDLDGRPDLAVGRLYREIVDVLLNRTAAFPVPVLVSNVEATVHRGHVRLVWHSILPELSSARVERSSNGAWQEAGVVRSDRPEYAMFEEQVDDGEYDYRLVVDMNGEIIRAGEVHISVHTSVRLAIEACRWDASARAIRATLSLPSSSPARLEIIDVSGRIVTDDRWTPAAAGTHGRTIELGSGVASGVYWTRLHQEGRSVARAVVVLE